MLERLTRVLGPRRARADRTPLPLDADWFDGYEAGERLAPFVPPQALAPRDAEAWTDGYNAGRLSWQAW